jgi:hypothetical protein
MKVLRVFPNFWRKQVKEGSIQEVEVNSLHGVNKIVVNCTQSNDTFNFISHFTFKGT